MRVAIALTLVAVAAATPPAPATAKPARPDKDPAGPGSGPAPSAQPASPADQAAKQAEDLAAAGDFPGAAAKFREAYALDRRPELLCNIGVAFHKAKDLARAQLYLGECLGRVGSLEPSFATAIRAVYGAIEDKLRAGDFAPVDIVVDPSSATLTISAFDADDKIVGSRLVWLPFGTHTITVRAEGRVEATRTIEIKSRDRRSETVTLEREKAVAPPPVMVERPSWKPALYASIATGAVGIAALGSYLYARSRASDAGTLDLTDDEYQGIVDSARGWQKVSWVLAGATAAGAIVSGYLWYQGTRPETRVEVTPTTTGAVLSVRSRF